MANIWQYAEQQTDNDHQQMATAQQLAKQAGYLMAVEVQSVGIDISFSPVLDVNGISQVIGDRAFHHQPEKVIALAGAFVDGMHNANMKSTGKHFPGHGSVLEDSHIAMPVDERSQQQIFDYDMAVFKALINAKKVDAIMPAHVIYPAIDNLPVGFSAKWLKEILRNTLGFEGVIFSDDLSMQGAKSVGSIVDRVEMADQAGCDMLLVCNNRKDAILAIDNAKLIDNKSRIKRLNAMMLKSSDSFDKLKNNKHWQEASSIIQQIWPNN
jgi:beta-N-acetylhexosaminidase